MAHLSRALFGREKSLANERRSLAGTDFQRYEQQIFFPPLSCPLYALAPAQRGRAAELRRRSGLTVCHLIGHLDVPPFQRRIAAAMISAFCR